LREWAVRVALGADRRAIVGLIVGRSLTLVLIGVIPGLLIAAAFGRGFSRCFIKLRHSIPCRSASRRS
jgi:ABC-type antimicrobial peptide transport system permease subunit